MKLFKLKGVTIKMLRDSTPVGVLRDWDAVFRLN